MFNPKRFLSIIMSMFFMVGMAGSLTASAGGNQDPVADVMIGSGGINWLPKVNYEQLQVTVSRPDGTVFQKTFSSGGTPYLDLSNIFGTGYCDGMYTYELRVINPSQAKIRKNMEKAGLPQSTRTEALTQTGYFTVMGGSILSNRAEEPSRVMDVLHYDDVIITGSLCIGFDCADGESFGYDTLKLKENNLQIYFDDTSSTAGFPANDWRIVTNDTASGGGNYFSIQDSTGGSTPFKIEAGAPANALYVEDYGRIGLGTSTPIVQLHMVDGDTPDFRLEQDTSYGWTAQVWDIAGNETNFFIRDVTGGSRLPFRIQPGTPTNALTLRAATGTDPFRVGIGTWSPEYPLELETTGANAAFVCDRTDGAKIFFSATTTYGQFGTTSNHAVRILVNSAWKMQLNSDNSLSMASGASCTAGGTWTNSSSRALKENVQSLGTDEAMDTLNRLNPVKFNYKVDKAEKHVGFIAEDAPELVATSDRKGMSPMDVVAVLTKVLQEQQKTVEEQQKAIAELQKKIAELEKK